MATTTKKKATRVNARVRLNHWKLLAIASIVANVVFIGGLKYLIIYQPLTTSREVLMANCSPEGYARIMKKLHTYNDKRFAAAALCFTDYDSGKPLDITSFKPLPDSQVILKPKS